MFYAEVFWWMRQVDVPSGRLKCMSRVFMPSVTTSRCAKRMRQLSGVTVPSGCAWWVSCWMGSLGVPRACTPPHYAPDDSNRFKAQLPRARARLRDRALSLLVLPDACTLSNRLQLPAMGLCTRCALVPHIQIFINLPPTTPL